MQTEDPSCSRFIPKDPHPPNPKGQDTGLCPVYRNAVAESRAQAEKCPLSSLASAAFCSSSPEEDLQEAAHFLAV